MVVVDKRETTYIEERCQSAPNGERADHDRVHLVVDDVPGAFEVKREDDLVHPVVLVSVLVRNLRTVTGVVKKERVVRARVTDEPTHGVQNVFPSRS
jgi:hypothetical protein